MKGLFILAGLLGLAYAAPDANQKQNKARHFGCASSCAGALLIGGQAAADACQQFNGVDVPQKFQQSCTNAWLFTEACTCIKQTPPATQKASSTTGVPTTPSDTPFECQGNKCVNKLNFVWTSFKWEPCKTFDGKKVPTGYESYCDSAKTFEESCKCFNGQGSTSSAQQSKTSTSSTPAQVTSSSAVATSTASTTAPGSSVTSSATEPGVTSSATEPGVTSSATEPGVTSSATEPVISSSATGSASISTTPGAQTEPSATGTQTNDPSTKPPGVTSSQEWTTSTVYTTSVITVTSCEPEVTECVEGPRVVTKTIAISTTVCPVTKPTDGPKQHQTEPPKKSTTATIYTTEVYTVTKCPVDTPDCPEGTVVTTKTYAVSTTVRPVETGKPTQRPSSGAPPPGTVVTGHQSITTKVSPPPGQTGGSTPPPASKGVPGDSNPPPASKSAPGDGKPGGNAPATGLAPPAQTGSVSKPGNNSTVGGVPPTPVTAGAACVTLSLAAAVAAAVAFFV